jgi:hypothetical protein
MNHLPRWITLLSCMLMVIHGPIAQIDGYHDFADQSVWLGVPHAADVLSNLGFAFVALWGLLALHPQCQQHPLVAGWPGYRLFLVGLLLTAVGSSYYHLAPDNASLVWDRLPIALACAGLLAAVRSETVPGANGARDALGLGVLALFSVGWWRYTDLQGAGDLRPYLLLQGLPIVLIPVWQTIYRAPRLDRLWFGLALSLYVFAKLAELNDHQISQALVWISGHTLKHLLATAATALIVGRLMLRARAGADVGWGNAGPRSGRLRSPTGSSPSSAAGWPRNWPG